MSSPAPLAHPEGGARLSSMQRIVRPALIAIPLYLVALGYLGQAFVSASSTARGTSSDGVFPRTLLGMPVLEGFATDGRFGVHVQWGSLVVLVVPALIAAVLTVIALVRTLRDPS